MKKMITGGLAAIAATVAVTAYAQNGIGINRDNLVAQYHQFRLGCHVNGTPAEFPNDLEFVNAGPVTIAKGKKIAWRLLAAPYYQASYTLTSDLKPGKAVRASNVLPNGVEAGKSCSARVM